MWLVVPCQISTDPASCYPDKTHVLADTYCYLPKVESSIGSLPEFTLFIEASPAGLG